MKRNPRPCYMCPCKPTTPELHRDRFNECHHNPTTQDIRMECLNDLGGFYGVEVLDTKKGECMYLNAGDTYTPTLVRWNGAYRVACWGDIVERHGVADHA